MRSDNWISTFTPDLVTGLLHYYVSLFKRSYNLINPFASDKLSCSRLSLFPTFVHGFTFAFNRLIVRATGLIPPHGINVRATGLTPLCRSYVRETGLIPSRCMNVLTNGLTPPHCINVRAAGLNVFLVIHVFFSAVEVRDRNVSEGKFFLSSA